MHPVKAFRRKQLISQAELACLAGVTQSQIAHIESGRRPVTPELAKTLERVTNGQLTRIVLLPEIFGPISEGNTDLGDNHGTPTAP